MPTIWRLLLPVLVLGSTVAPIFAQTPRTVRVVDRAVPIVRWLPPTPPDVVATVDGGTTLEVIGSEGSWYWVITPRDGHGMRRGGWIPARRVDIVLEAAPAAVRATVRQGPASDERARVAPALEARAADPPREPPGPAPAGARYEFEEVHFARNRSDLDSLATRILDGAAAALSHDRLLRLTIEGHTCSLGATAYNLALGAHRAAAVRDYLLSRGVAADRLQTASAGEERPSHDNSREETRRLNRRVVLVPE